MRLITLLTLISFSSFLLAQNDPFSKIDFFVQETMRDSAMLYLASMDDQEDLQVEYRSEFLRILNTPAEMEAGMRAMDSIMAVSKYEPIPAMVKVTYQSHYSEQLIPYDILNEYNLALVDSTLALFDQGGEEDSYLLMHLLHNRGNLLYELGRHHESILAIEKSLELAERIDTRNSSMIGVICHNLSKPLKKINEFHRSYEMVERSAAELSSLEDPNLDYFQTICLNLFSASLDLGYVEKAENYLKKAEQIYFNNADTITGGVQIKKDQRVISLLYNRMLLYNHTEDEQSSLETLAEADQKFNQHQDYYFRLRLAASYDLMGETYVVRTPEKSFEYYQKALQILNAGDEDIYTMKFQRNLAKAYINTKQYDKASKLALSLIARGELTGDYRLPYYHYILAREKIEKGLFNESIGALSDVVKTVNKGEIEIDLLAQTGLESFEPTERLDDGYLLVEAAKALKRYVPESRESNLVMNSLYNLAIANLTSNHKNTKFAEKTHIEYQKMLNGLITTDRYLGKESMAFSDLIKFSENTSSRQLWEKFKFKNQQLERVDPALLAEEQAIRSAITKLKLSLESEDSTSIRAQLFEQELAVEKLELEKREKYTSFYRYEDFNFDFDAYQKTLANDQIVLKYEVLDSILYRYSITDSNVEIVALDSIGVVHVSVQGFVERLRTPSSDLGLIKQMGEDLYDVLMPAELPENIQVISDGILHYLPFDLLQKNGAYLVENYTISNAISLALSTQDVNDNAIKTTMIMAPSYDDYTLSSQQLAVRGAAYNLEGALGEAEAISSLISSDKFARSAASKKAFVDQAENYDLLHLSMHSFMNDEDPELSSLVFHDGEQENELYISELYGMNLNAKLAVLSACNTGVGAVKTGEGMVSVNRAFTYAGVPAVISSLWSAPDQATKEVMTGFYKELKSGKRKSEALRNAKMAYLDGQAVEALKHPFFWGGFVLHGNTEGLDFVGISQQNMLLISIFGLLLVVIAFWYFQRRNRAKTTEGALS